MSHTQRGRELSTTEDALLASLDLLAISGANQGIAKTGIDTFENRTFSTSGGGTWGSITGTLSDQTDLQTVLDTKIDNPMTTLGDIIYGGVSGTPTRLPANATSSLLFLSSVDGLAPSYQPVPALGTLVYYWTPTASDVATYYKETSAPYSSITTFSVAGATDGQLLRTFVTEPNNPNRTFIPDGQYSCHVHARQTAGTKDVYIRAEIWEVTKTGVDIAMIASTGPSTILTGTVTECFIAESVAQYDLALATSRIATKLYAVVSGTGSAPTIEISTGGVADSRTNLPAPIIDATNFVPYVGATTNIDIGSFGITGTGIFDFGGATTLEIPNSATPTLNTTGQIAVDTTVTDFTNGLLKYYSTAEYGVVAMPIAQFTSPTNGYVPKYNSTTDAFELSSTGTGNVVGPAAATDNAVVRFDGTTGTLVQNSVVTINDVGVIDGVVAITSDTVVVNTHLRFDKANNTSSGANASIGSLNDPVIRFTGALTSIDMANAGFANQFEILYNATGGTITINHDTGATAGNRFYCPGGVGFALVNQSAVQILYSADASRWIVISN